MFRIQLHAAKMKPLLTTVTGNHQLASMVWPSANAVDFFAIQVEFCGTCEPFILFCYVVRVIFIFSFGGWFLGLLCHGLKGHYIQREVNLN
jgi:hypothetical protein